MIDFSRSAAEIIHRMRGFQPWPGAYTTFRDKKLQILKAATSTQSIPPGELVLRDDSLSVGCSHGTSLELQELQLEGKRRTSAADFVNGYRPRTGERLGS